MSGAATTTISGPFGELRLEREYAEFRSIAPRRDKDWTYTDKRGHDHSYADGGYPTLKWVVDETFYCEDCQDEHENGHYECRECGEHIEPGMAPPPAIPERVLVAEDWTLNGEPIDRATAERLVADARAGEA